MTPAHPVNRIAGRAADLVVPRLCAGCGAPVGLDGAPWCAGCARELAALVGGDYCRACGEDANPHLLIDRRCGACRLRTTGRLRFEQFVRAGRYAGALRVMILRFKREFVLEDLLGHMLADAIQAALDPREVDLWIPVPSHWLRRLRRGFQPSFLLTRRAVRRWGGRAEPALVMTRYVREFHVAQALSRQQRAKAIAGAFRLSARASVAGRTVCLVDDVTNTGATLAEAKRALRAAGAGRLFAAVLAKTAPHARPPRPGVAGDGLDPAAGRA